MKSTKTIKEKKADISAEQMVLDGWIKTDDPMFIYEKLIPNRNPINCTPEDSDIKLVIHGFFGSWMFAVLLPDGGMLNFIANSMQELKDFENKISFYDPPY